MAGVLQQPEFAALRAHYLAALGLCEAGMGLLLTLTLAGDAALVRSSG